MITVVTLADSAYAMPLAVMVRSLLDTLSQSRRVYVVIVDGGLSDSQKAMLQTSWQSSPGWPRARIEFTRPAYAGSRDLPVWGRLPIITYSRISVESYVSQSCSRLVLLDSDILVLKDVSQLFDLELSGATIGATQDPYIPFVSSRDGLACYRELGLAPDWKYFNAGVMLVDVERWREQEVAIRAFEFLARHWNSVHHYDQDALNAVLARQWKQLDQRWQAHPRLNHSCGVPAGEDAFILHFSGRLKPWSYRASGDADRHFYQVLDRTAWRGWRPPGGLRSLAYRVYDSPLRRFVYPIEARLLSWRRRIERRHRVSPCST